ncbi:ABC transporter permease subunit [Neomegalonema sp.]|uniref:amino acid ABC transporter permease n=1 Tax=Neomegalonema sp. TaxID=2039713 RepID=UPI002614B5B0|nr:ABC transporter permease subunit [Neomegalonema sp.]MDD2867923.1 ABC transporter permease subunit [Neomegalonema sp.]
MTASAETPSSGPTRAASRPAGSLLYDPKVRSIFFQVALLVAVIAFFAWIVQNTTANLRARNISSGFDFLGNTPGFQTVTTLGTYLMDVSGRAITYLDVLKVGLINTLLVAVLGVVTATVVGFVIGVFRLSSNSVLYGFSTIYVELLRNTPLLLQIFFWYFAALRAPWVPDARGRVSFFWDSFHFNITGLYGPYPLPQPGFDATLWAVALGVALTVVMRWWARRRQDATGKQFPIFWGAVGLIVGLPLLVFLLTGSPLRWEAANFVEDGPVLRRGFQKGSGMLLIPELIALWLALSLYTAAFIAEIVRAGILAVNKGQTEAAHALGISQGKNLRLVVIPQALRVIIPPLTSQYLNITKNSSLAVAIAYPDFFSQVQISLNQTGRAIELIVIAMLVYLTFSLITSAFMNYVNSRMKLVER